MWDLPGPGLEPVFPALTGGFLTTAPPGKSLNVSVFMNSRKIQTPGPHWKMEGASEPQEEL